MKGWREDSMTASSLRNAVARDQAASVIDDDHLRRMTLGDQRLEREVLEIFVRQIAIMLTRLGEADPALTVATAHTLKGSARGIGAWRVERAAERLEATAAAHPARKAFVDAVAELQAAASETSAAIGARLAVTLVTARGH
jgi:HPt (histidine-containing phosphotransfer) domain-containing protein